MRGDERSGRMMRLLEYLNEQGGPVPVVELAELARREFGVTEVTLRSDLAALSALAAVRKTGRAAFGVVGEPGGPGGSLFATRLLHRAEAKLAIAGATAAAVLAHAGLRVLLLDAGTTACYVAELLAERSGMDLIAWTPSVAAAERLARAQGVSVRLLGGELNPDYAVVTGDETARALRALAGAGPGGDERLPPFPGTHCVLDVNYVAKDGRLYTDESRERLQKRLMVELAEEVTVVADATKLFGPRLGLQAHEICGLADLADRRTVRLITDTGLAAGERDTAARLLRDALPAAESSLTEVEGALVFTARGAGTAAGK